MPVPLSLEPDQRRSIDEATDKLIPSIDLMSWTIKMVLTMFRSSTGQKPAQSTF
jgi:hypothetical protein